MGETAEEQAGRHALGLLREELGGLRCEWTSTPEALADQVRQLFGPPSKQPTSGPPWLLVAGATAATAWRLFGGLSLYHRAFSRAEAQRVAVKAALYLSASAGRPQVVGSAS